MYKNKILKILALLLAFTCLIVCQTNSTLCFLATKTESVVNTFVSAPFEPQEITLDIHIDVLVKNIGDFNITPEGFTLILENVETGEKVTVTSDETGDALFSLPFTEQDVGKEYTYKLYQLDCGKEDIIYDTKVYEIIINITYDGYELVPIISLDGKVVEVPTAVFVNTLRISPSPAPPTLSDNAAFWAILMLVSGYACFTLAFADKHKFRKKKS